MNVETRADAFAEKELVFPSAHAQFMCSRASERQRQPGCVCVLGRLEFRVAGIREYRRTFRCLPVRTSAS